MSVDENERSKLKGIVVNATYRDSKLGTKAVELSESDYWYLCERAGLANELEREFSEFKDNVEKMYKHTHINAKKRLDEKEMLKLQNEYYRETLERLKNMAMNMPIVFVDFSPVGNPFADKVYHIANEALEKKIDG